jgi:hypothetical protein
MSKSAKKSGKSKSRQAEQPDAPVAAEQPVPAGQLIALDGTRGRDLADSARKLVKLLDCKPGAGLSQFDSSNTFFELRMAKGKRGSASPVTLVLLYASDLLFRLRWEIRPALAEGRTVVAAPYVQTAIGFGLSAGLSREWLEELFAFAPPPDGALRLKEKRKGKDKEGKGASGYFDFCCWSLSAISPQWTANGLREGILKHFDALADQGKVATLGKKLPKKFLRKD